MKSKLCAIRHKLYLLTEKFIAVVNNQLAKVDALVFYWLCVLALILVLKAV